MGEDNTLYLQLHKLCNIKSEEALEHILTTLWSTRKTGLNAAQKSHIHSLLLLPSLGELYPVLASLRSLIRKNVHESFTGDDILKLLPPDLALDVKNILILLFQKYQSLWKEDISREQMIGSWCRTAVKSFISFCHVPCEITEQGIIQKTILIHSDSIIHQLPRTVVACRGRIGVPPSFQSLPSSEVSTPLWPRQDDPVSHINCGNLGPRTLLLADVSVPRLAPLSIQHDVGPLDNLGILPHLKSMTWTMENRNSAPAHRLAVISLKLHDYTKSPLGEKEVKFQLTKDTLEAMLRSMVYISEQLSAIANLGA
ncbi:protein FAR1-RELATED SEQUENCE 3-like isoform X2 [Malania oleifera]|uniref:protein FAR1-RELATED SEQUENCE 3-like isoform X2 n=1 Tax=Malania oleifera TaxID=397392 RepID=UPI0025AE6F5D|nr:protein FAR1-RELATED SEQUENCE 3-like isoform X2 [Malania oleifera]